MTTSDTNNEQMDVDIDITAVEKSVKSGNNNNNNNNAINENISSSGITKSNTDTKPDLLNDDNITNNSNVNNDSNSNNNNNVEEAEQTDTEIVDTQHIAINPASMSARSSSMSNHDDSSNTNPNASANTSTASINTPQKTKKSQTPRKSMTPAKRKLLRQKLQEKLKKYREIITVGCGDWRCLNPYCKSNEQNENKKYTDSSASKISLTMVKKKAKACAKYGRRPITRLSFAFVNAMLNQNSNTNTAGNTEGNSGEADADADENKDDGDIGPELIKVVDQTFSHFDALEECFLPSSNDVVNEKHAKINFVELDKTFQAIIGNETLKVLMIEALTDLLKELEEKSEWKMNLKMLRVLLILIENPIVFGEDGDHYDSLFMKILQMVSKLEVKYAKILQVWFSNYTDSDRLRRLLNSLHMYMTLEIAMNEASIEDMTNDWMVDLRYSDLETQEERDDVERRVEKKQQKHREQYISKTISKIVAMMDILFKANNIMIEETARLDEEVSKSKSQLLTFTKPTKEIDDNISLMEIDTTEAEEENNNNINNDNSNRPKTVSMSTVDSGVSSSSVNPAVDLESVSASNTTPTTIDNSHTIDGNTNSNPESNAQSTAAVVANNPGTAEEDELKIEPITNMGGGTESQSESESMSHSRRLSMVGISHRKHPLPLTAFHNDGLNEAICAKDHQRLIIHQRDFIHWKDKDSFTFLDHEYLLHAASKARYLEFENLLRQYHARRRRMFDLMFAQQSSMFVNRDRLMQELDLVLNVRRTHIISDTLGILQLQEAPDLRKRLRIFFDGEQGIDQGGLTKEYFQLVCKELFDPSYGMFVHNSEREIYWFNTDAFLLTGDELGVCQNYELIGKLMGIALYNNTILDLRFPKVIFKKLLGFETINFLDFTDFDPEMARGFEKLLTFEGDVENVYCRQFVYEYANVFGMDVKVDLCPNGKNINLTKQNRQEYVDLYINYMLVTSIDKQFSAFKKGFKMVCNSELFSKFKGEELELLICGSQEFDFEALEDTARYEDGLHKNSRIVKEFWVIAHSLSENDKRKLLKFCTGSDRVPIAGLGELRLKISKNGTDNTKLPTSHTCFNHLLLPEYSTQQILKARLLLAIQNSEGFGLL